MEADALAILSRHGWDLLGQNGKLVEFRHANTGEIATVAPAEIVMWAAQLVPPKAPAAPGDWYAERVFGHCGMVGSRSGQRRIGVTHDQQGRRWFFFGFDGYDRAERAAALLNARDMPLVRQETLW